MTPNEPEPKILTPEREKTKSATHMEIEETNPHKTGEVPNPPTIGKESENVQHVESQETATSSIQKETEMPTEIPPGEITKPAIEPTKIQEEIKEKDTQSKEESMKPKPVPEGKKIQSAIKASYL